MAGILAEADLIKRQNIDGDQSEVVPLLRRILGLLSNE
jgi:hypothetical protein